VEAASAQQVLAVLSEVSNGTSDPAEAGRKLAGMVLPEQERMSRDQLWLGDDSDYTPGSIVEVSMAEAAGKITSAVSQY